MLLDKMFCTTYCTYCKQMSIWPVWGDASAEKGLARLACKMTASEIGPFFAIGRTMDAFIFSSFMNQCVWKPEFQYEQSHIIDWSASLESFFAAVVQCHLMVHVPLAFSSYIGLSKGNRSSKKWTYIPFPSSYPASLLAITLPNLGRKIKFLLRCNESNVKSYNFPRNRF